MMTRRYTLNDWKLLKQNEIWLYYTYYILLQFFIDTHAFCSIKAIDGEIDFGKKKKLT